MGQSKLVSTVVIGGSSIYQEGLRLILRRHGFEVSSHIADPGDVERIASAEATVYIVVAEDDRLGGPARVVNLLRADRPSSCIVVLASPHPVDQGGTATMPGVNTRLPLSISPEGLVAALDLTLSERLIVSKADLPDQHRSAAFATAPDPSDFPLDRPGQALTERERAILQRLLRGESNRHVALALRISEATVKAHIASLLAKIGIHSRAQAVIWAWKNDGSSSNGGSPGDKSYKN